MGGIGLAGSLSPHLKTTPVLKRQIVGENTL
jgi:hypothetical protein